MLGMDVHDFTLERPILKWEIFEIQRTLRKSELGFREYSMFSFLGILEKWV